MSGRSLTVIKSSNGHVVSTQLINQSINMSGEIRKGMFEWNVDRFLERKRECKRSSKFQVWSDNCNFYIPDTDARDQEISEYYPLYLENFSNSTCSAERMLKLCLIGPNGKEILTVNGTLRKIISDGLFLFLTIRDKELCEDADLLPGGTLTVRLSWYEERDEKRPMEMLEILSRDLSRFYISSANTDCVLKVGNTEFRAHRTVLSARSEVFAALFHHETSENRTGVVDILDVEADVMSDFINYIYAGTVQGLTTSTAVPLFVVAEKYGLKLLQEACLSFLTDNLTVGNVCDAAILADVYGEEEFEKKVVQFIGDGMADVQGSAEWKEFTVNKPSIAIKLLFSLMVYKDAKK